MASGVDYICESKDLITINKQVIACFNVAASFWLIKNYHGSYMCHLRPWNKRFGYERTSI